MQPRGPLPSLEEFPNMTPSPAKPTPVAPVPEADRGHPKRLAGPVGASRRGADLEAQKRYMDDRFGRDRPMIGKRRA